MLVIIIAIYKRPELTEIVLNYYKRLQKKYLFKIVVAGSEGKPVKGVDYIETPNFPLSNKNNLMMQRAKVHNPDAVVLLGSDDFICENVIKYYYDLIKRKETAVIGFYDLYFYSTEHDILSYYECGERSFGAGRYFPKSALNKIKWTGWAGEYDRGLDGNNMKLLEAKNVEHKVVKLTEIGGFLLDVKHDLNITDKNITFRGTKVKKSLLKQYKIPIKITKLWLRNQSK